MAPTVSVQVVHVQSRPPEYIEACLKSISEEGFDVVVVPASDNITEGRLRALEKQSTEYVGIVDDDDYLLPGAGNHIRETLQKLPEAMCGGEIFVGVDRVSANTINLAPLTAYSVQHNVMAAHHPLFFRREHLLAACTQLTVKGIPCGSEWLAVAIAMSRGRVIKIPTPLYAWRVHPGQYTKTGRNTRNYATVGRMVRETLRSR